MKIDFGLMMIAVRDDSDSGLTIDTGFLNRTTGEIVFLCDNEDVEETARNFNIPADELRARRARVESDPQSWVEIPKNVHVPPRHEHWCDMRTKRPSCTCGALDHEDDEEESFVREFLKENGIEAELV